MFLNFKVSIFRLSFFFCALALPVSGIASVDLRTSYSQEHFTDQITENSVSSSQLLKDDNEDIRIEYEIKLKLPPEQIDDVWNWLTVRYKELSWLNDEEFRFTAEFGDEDFTDTYFDTPDLILLSENNGIRFRMRTVHSGPAMDKDGRQLIQLKLNRGDATGASRSEVKFNVSPGDDRKGIDDSHAMIGLVKSSQRGQFKNMLYTRRIDPYQLKPLLTLKQNRRRIYLSDQNGAFATLTLDLCTTKSWGTNLKWAELELELNEIRYTKSNPEVRLKMERIIAKIQDDVQQVFPMIVPNQTPKYNTAFASIEKATWIPVQQLFSRKISVDGFSVISLIFTVVLIAGTFYIGRLVWLRISKTHK